MNGAGYVLAAGGVALANDAVFAPLESSGNLDLGNIGVNWRIVPATAILALLIGGVESMNEGFGKGLGALVLLSVLVIPFGNAGTPLENLAKIVGTRKV